MTNNRKPVDEVRLSWDAEAAFKRLNDKQRHHAVEPHEYIGEYKIPYTPPPAVAAWLQAQADKPKGRDYEAILRAAKKAPVGYYEDAPRGIKFGGQPLPSAGHGKDADGPWPRYFIPTDPRQSAACIFVDAHTSDVFWRGFTNKDRRLVTHNALPEAGDKRWSEVSVSAFAQWLEQNGHKDVAAQLRGKAINSLSIPTKLIGEEFEPERTIPVVGDRFNYGGEVCTVTRIDHTREFAVRFLRCEASHEDGLKISYFTDKNSLRILKRPVADNAIPRDAILSECRKAMGLK